MKLSEEEKTAIYLDYKRGWQIGATGASPILIGPPAPTYPEEFQRGYNDGFEAFKTNMQKQFNRIQQLG